MLFDPEQTTSTLGRRASAAQTKMVPVLWRSAELMAHAIPELALRRSAGTSVDRKEDALGAADGCATAAPVAACPCEGPLRLGWRRLRRAFCRIFVIADYERYVPHVAEHHHGEASFSRREFFVRSIDRQYGKSRTRCC